MKYKFTRASFGCHTLVEFEKDAQLHITDLGKGEPIVFVNGISHSTTMFENEYQHLMKAGYRVIGISIQGFGLSDRPKIIPFSLAEQLYEAIPSALFVPAENSSHSLFLEEMEKLNLTIQRFIS